MLTRRKLIKDGLQMSAAIMLSRSGMSFAEADSPISLSLGKTKPVSIPANFIGLGYEMSSVAPLGLLSAENHPYFELVKRLGPSGVLRVGGIVANYTKYEPNGTIKAERQDTVITRASLEQFGGFLKKTGWQTIWSVNFAQGTIEEAVAEAIAVKSILGSRLLALEIGNEIENYFRGPKPFRKAPYEYETYRKEYSEWHDAIVKAVPGVAFAAPDTASNVEWVERMAKDAHGDVQLLTTHYYRTGQNRGSADQLLHPDPKLLDVLARLRTASEQSGIPWRMCETSSFSGGGLKGVSDTMIGALWTLDYMLLLEQNGCAGVNIETGVNQLGFISSYSPIQDDLHGLNSAGVPYYGMLAYSEAHKGCTQSIEVAVPESAPGVTAYGLGTAGKIKCVVLVNRSESDRQLSLAEVGFAGRVSQMRLSAPAPDSKSGVSFAGTSVDANGKWKAAKVEQGKGTSIALPRMSAVVVRN